MLLMSMTYPNAVPLPKTKSQALALMLLSWVLAVGSFLLVSVVLPLFGPWIMAWLDVQALGYWFYMLPVLLMLYNLASLLSPWYTRTEEFRTRAGVDVVTSIVG